MSTKFLPKSSRSKYGSYIYLQGSRFIIQKSLNKKVIQFGSYKTNEDAILVRDLLIKNKWNINYFKNHQDIYIYNTNFNFQVKNNQIILKNSFYPKFNPHQILDYIFKKYNVNYSHFKDNHIFKVGLDYFHVKLEKSKILISGRFRNINKVNGDDFFLVEIDQIRDYPKISSGYHPTNCDDFEFTNQKRI